MKKLLLGVALAASMLAAAPAANAAQFFNLTPAVDGTYSAAFGADGIVGPTFTHTYDFNLLLNGVGSGTISSILTFGTPSTDVNFTSVTLNGQEFTISSSGVAEFRYLDFINIVSGPQQLVVKGTSGGNGSYGGQLSFASAVPEPATWAMMIVGFGAAGAAIRRRKLVPSVA